MTPSKLSELILASSSFEDLEIKVRQQFQRERLLPNPNWPPQHPGLAPEYSPRRIDLLKPQ